MKKVNLSKVMKRAHEIKKSIKNAIWSLCLKMAWDESKKENEEISLKDKLINMGFKLWKKAGLQRIYIDAQHGKYGVQNVADNYKRYKKLNMYYDVIEECFCWNFMGNSSTETIHEYIDFLKTA